MTPISVEQSTFSGIKCPLQLLAVGDDRRVLPMSEVLRIVDLGIASADAESVQLLYQFGDLLLRYMDWQEVEREKKFHDVLAFRWQAFTDDAPRNDVSYEVENSGWLALQATAQEVESANYAHFRICFNQNGVLDVLALRI